MIIKFSFFNKEIYYFNIIDCNIDYSIRDFLKKAEQLVNKYYCRFDDDDDDEKINKICLKNIHYVYLKGHLIEENSKLRDYLDDLENAPLIITDDPTKIIENYLLIINLNNYDNLQFHSRHNYVNFTAIDKTTKKKVLIKSIYSFNFQQEYNELISYQQLSTLNHCGIAKILGFRYPLTEKEKMKTDLLTFQSNEYKYDLTKFIIVFEFVENGKINSIVYDYLKTKGEQHEKINPTIRSKIIYGVASAMKYMHRKRVIHRYLSLNSILCDENFEPKITRNNLMVPHKTIIDVDKGIGGDPFTMAPDIYMDGNYFYDYPSDVYSYALFFYKFFSNKVEFKSGTTIRSFQMYMSRISNGNRPIRPENISDAYWNLIQKFWIEKPSKRPTFEEIVEELKNDKYAIEEYGMKTNLDELHEYQTRIDSYDVNDSSSFNLKVECIILRNQIDKFKSVFLPKINSSKRDIFFIDNEEKKFHQIVSKIGENNSSISYKVVDKRTGEMMYKKILKSVENEKILQKSLKEFESFLRVDNLCICKAIGMSTTEVIIKPNINVSNKKENKDSEYKTIAFFYEFDDYSLSEKLNSMSNTLKAKIVIEIVHAMKCIHEKGMILRNLKIDSIRLNSIYEAKIVDFSYVENRESMIKDDETIPYMSPEMLNDGEYDNSTDVYSFGILLYYMFTGLLPKQDMEDKKAGKTISLPKSSESISDFCIYLISECLSFDPMMRPAFDVILEMIRNNSYFLASFVNSNIVYKRDNELDLYEKNNAK